MADRSTTRRRWLRSCVGVTGAIAVAGCSGGDDGSETSESGSSNGSGSSELGSDWPMYGVDLQNTGYQPNAIGPEGDVERREILDIEGRSPFPVAIVDGVIYVSSTAGKIYAVDVDTEELLWENEGYGAPAVFDGMVYGPTDEGQVYGYDTDTGDRWEADKIESIIGLGGPIPTPNGIFVASHETIWKIDTDTGEYTEVITTPDFVGGSTDKPAFHNNTFYIARASDLYAVNVDTPEIEWKFEPDNSGRLSDSNPAIKEDTIYLFNREYQLCAIDLDSGEEVWTVNTDERVEMSPTVTNNRIYFGDSNQVVAVDRDGGIEWESTEDITGTPEHIVVSGDMCYASSQFGIQAFDSSSGSLEWSYDVDDSLNGGFTAPPRTHDGCLYIPANDDTLYAIE